MKNFFRQIRFVLKRGKKNQMIPKSKCPYGLVSNQIRTIAETII